MKRTFLTLLCAPVGLFSHAYGQADPDIDALLDQIQQEINSSPELQSLRSRIIQTGESPGLVPDPNAPRPAPQPPAQPRRVVLPPSTPAPVAPDPTDAILAQIQQEISQNSEVAALRNRLSNIPSFGPDFAEPSPPPPGSEPQPAPQAQRLPQPSAPEARQAPMTSNTVDESGQLPAVLPMPESYGLPNSNVPTPPAFESADSPPRRPEAPMQLPSWDEPESTPTTQASSAMPEPQPSTAQGPFGSPRAQESPPESADRGKPGFFSRVFSRNEEASVQAQAATAFTPDVSEPTAIAPPPPTPVPEPSSMPPVEVSENATEIASLGNEPKPTPTLLPSARIPASEAIDPEIDMDDADIPPLLRPLKLDWLKGSASEENAVIEP